MPNSNHRCKTKTNGKISWEVGNTDDRIMHPHVPTNVGSSYYKVPPMHSAILSFIDFKGCLSAPGKGWPLLQISAVQIRQRAEVRTYSIIVNFVNTERGTTGIEKDNLHR